MIVIQAGLAKSESLCPKIIRTKRADGVAQTVEHLPHKHEALSSNPVLWGKKQKKNAQWFPLLLSTQFPNRSKHPLLCARWNPKLDKMGAEQTLFRFSELLSPSWSSRMGSQQFHQFLTLCQFCHLIGAKPLSTLRLNSYFLGVSDRNIISTSPFVSFQKLPMVFLLLAHWFQREAFFCTVLTLFCLILPLDPGSPLHC
jgi:hypothetical protein